MQYDQREDSYNAEKSKTPAGSEPIPNHIQRAKAPLTADWKIGKAVQEPADLQCASGTMQGTPSGGSKSAIIAKLDRGREGHRQQRDAFLSAAENENLLMAKYQTAINILTLHPETEVIVELLQLGIVL